MGFCGVFIGAHFFYFNKKNIVVGLVQNLFFLKKKISPLFLKMSTSKWIIVNLVFWNMQISYKIKKNEIPHFYYKDDL